MCASIGKGGTQIPYTHNNLGVIRSRRSSKHSGTQHPRASIKSVYRCLHIRRGMSCYQQYSSTSSTAVHLTGFTHRCHISARDHDTRAARLVALHCGYKSPSQQVHSSEAGQWTSACWHHNTSHRVMGQHSYCTSFAA